MHFYEEEEPSFFRKHRLIVGCVVVAAIASAVWFGKGIFDRTSQARQEQKVTMVNLTPTALPPPPPPPTQTPPTPMENEPRMISQDPVMETESKPDDTAKDTPPSNDPPGLTTGIQGDGPADGFGLRGGSNFGGNTGRIANRGRSSRWGWYASQVQNSISQALQNNSSTRYGDFRVEARIWADRAGRITRANVAGSIGNESLANAITKEVLVGLILKEPPPEGMPMPIVIRLTARHSKMALSR